MERSEFVFSPEDMSKWANVCLSACSKDRDTFCVCVQFYATKYINFYRSHLFTRDSYKNLVQHWLTHHYINVKHVRIHLAALLFVARCWERRCCLRRDIWCAILGQGCSFSELNSLVCDIVSSDSLRVIDLHMQSNSP